MVWDYITEPLFYIIIVTCLQKMSTINQFKYLQAHDNVLQKADLNGHYLLLTEQNNKKLFSFSVHTCICVCVLSLTHTGFLSKLVFLKVKVCDALHPDCHSWLGSPRQYNWMKKMAFLKHTEKGTQCCLVSAVIFSMTLHRELFAGFLLSCISEEAYVSPHVPRLVAVTWSRRSR